MNKLRDLPSVDELLKSPRAAEMTAEYGRDLVLAAISSVLSDLREEISHHTASEVPEQPILLNQAKIKLEMWLEPSLLPVINATGVILHTNLGRAPISREALQAMVEASGGYSTLEFDLKRGARGSRSVHAESLLTLLTEAEAALVVNNNAAALLLCLSVLAKRKRVIIARSQLVEIGGGFRVPEVMSQSGAKLVEVGTTNRVHIGDFEAALAEPAALVMRAHHSNYKIIGFTAEPELHDIVQAAHAHNVPVIDDLGSGALLDTARYGVAHEPTVQESMEAGADLVCFSGDKLFGGPQAGIIIGKKSLVERIKKHPFARAVRADKTRLAGISATLLHYLKGEAETKIPVWQMLATSPEALRERAERWREQLGTGEVIAGFSTIGGGSLPEETLPTFLLALDTGKPNLFLSRLRRAHPPVIARIEAERVVFDPRTVAPDQEGEILSVLRAAIAQ